MKRDSIIDAITKVTGVTKEELFDAGSKKKNVSLARQIFAHIYLTTGASALSLSTESRISPAAWRKARQVMENALTEEDENKCELYDKVYMTLYPPKTKAKVHKTPSLGIRWTFMDDIHIEKAIKDSIRFMKNYGRAR